jgi:hypothetical protein
LLGRSHSHKITQHAVLSRLLKSGLVKSLLAIKRMTNLSLSHA